MKIIAIEEHFRPKCYHDYLLSRKDPPRLELVEDTDNNKVFREWITEKFYLIQT